MDIPRELPVIEKGHSHETVTEQIIAIPFARRTPRFWLVGFAVSFLLVMGFLFAVTVLFVQGVGIWGINIPVGWGFAIINLVWWIGIGHAGTLISAILLLMRQEWRTSINRFAEAMTLFAVAMAGLFPILHLGRPDLFFYLFPYPNRLGLWPQFRSPLVWDAFAILAYMTVSLMFWYMGLVPDLATMRDRTTSRFKAILFGILALGWRFSARHWHRYNIAYWLMAALATPLVISVHSIVSMDFAFALIPGWHSTIFPPYFVAGAVFSGFAMVLIITIPLRRLYHLEDFITLRHIDNMAKIMLGVGLVVAYGYLMETFTAFYSADEFEVGMMVDRLTGTYAPLFWGLILANIIIPQALWFRSIRLNPVLLFIISFFINTGMWLERFIIIIQSLHKDFLPSSWHIYVPTIWDVLTFAGTIGLFFALLFLFLRVLPAISMFEMRELVAEQEHEME